MQTVIFWFLAAVVVGVIAGSKGRSGFGWFVLAVLISPLLAGILVLVLGRPGGAVAVANGADQPNADTHVRCPDCRELVLRDARKCKHCGSGLVPQ